MIRFLMHIGGLDDASGHWYLFWSGIGGRFVIIGGMAALYHRHVCHVKYCQRPARHKVEGTPHVVCFKHSSFDQPRWKDIQEGKL